MLLRTASGLYDCRSLPVPGEFMGGCGSSSDKKALQADLERISNQRPAGLVALRGTYIRFRVHLPGVPSDLMTARFHQNGRCEHSHMSGVTSYTLEPGRTVKVARDGDHDLLRFPKEVVAVGQICSAAQPDGQTVDFTIEEVGELPPSTGGGGTGRWLEGIEYELKGMSHIRGRFAKQSGRSYEWTDNLGQHNGLQGELDGDQLAGTAYGQRWAFRPQRAANGELVRVRFFMSDVCSGIWVPCSSKQQVQSPLVRPAGGGSWLAWREERPDDPEFMRRLQWEIVERVNEIRRWHGCSPVALVTAKVSGAFAKNGFPMTNTTQMANYDRHWPPEGNVGKHAVNAWYSERFLAEWRWDQRGQIDQNPWARIGHHGAAVVYQQAGYVRIWMGGQGEMGFPGSMLWTEFYTGTHGHKMTVPPPTNEPANAEKEVMVGAFGSATELPRFKEQAKAGIAGGVDNLSRSIWTI